MFLVGTLRLHLLWCFGNVHSDNDATCNWQINQLCLGCFCCGTGRPPYFSGYANIFPKLGVALMTLEFVESINLLCLLFVMGLGTVNTCSRGVTPCYCPIKIQNINVAGQQMQRQSVTAWKHPYTTVLSHLVFFNLEERPRCTNRHTEIHQASSYYFG